MEYKTMIGGMVLAALVAVVATYIGQRDVERNLREPIIETCLKHRANQKVQVVE